MSVAIVDYGSGNLHSAAKAFERASRSLEEPQKIMVTRDPETVYRADRIVLPGVGAWWPLRPDVARSTPGSSRSSWWHPTARCSVRSAT